MQSYTGRRRVIGLFMAVLVLAAARSPAVTDFAALPTFWRVPRGQAVTIPWSRWIPLTASPGPGIQVAQPASVLRVAARQTGPSYVRLKWFGWIPFRTVPVRVTRPVEVVPGGQSIGVVVRTQGVIVTGYAPFLSDRGLDDPAAQAGIRPGDLLTRADGHVLTDAAALTQAVERAGGRRQGLTVRERTGQQTVTRVVHPVWNPAAARWQIGVRVQNTLSGVGTLTFWLPHSHRYTALGHSITDGLTPVPAGLAGGRLVGAQILGVVPSTDNDPGEKLGILTAAGGLAGTVTQNDRFGLAGTLRREPVRPARLVAVALPDEVHPGPAEIITVLHGLTPEVFSIQILQAYPQMGPAIKGILFRVTDRKLLGVSGGVVQGMSGSPILQGGRLVGAVTHVLVSQPTLGYGCYAAWMLDTLRTRSGAAP